MKQATRSLRLIAALFGTVFVFLLWPGPSRAADLRLPPGALQGLDLLYSGQPDRAMEVFRQIEAVAPDHPLGYLLEAEARWWQIYCEACEIKWNTLDAWHRPRQAGDDAYLELVDKATNMAEAQITKGDSAEMELYAGMGWGLRARLLGLRDDRRGTARAGVQGRAHLLRCLELDPQMADAYAGLGLYNYYVDTLSSIARVLRFLMGIPGGDKREGIRQMRIAMQQGVLTRAGTRFLLAKNLRNYDRDYASSIEVMKPLVIEYPQNPIFRLLLGDMQAKVGDKEFAAKSFNAAEQLPVSHAACAAHIRSLAKQELAAVSSQPNRTTE